MIKCVHELYVRASKNLYVEESVKVKELCKAPMLAYPDSDVPYVMDTDANNLAIGAVLSQVQDGEEKIIMYGSKAFSASKQSFRYNSFCNGEVFLLLVKPGVHTPYRPFVIKVARLIPQ